MKPIFKRAAAVALAGALVAATAAPSMARPHWRPWAAAGVGFLAGAAIASAANANSYYYNGYGGYAYQPGYTYEPGYAYGSGYTYAPYSAYGYERNDGSPISPSYDSRYDTYYGQSSSINGR